MVFVGQSAIRPNRSPILCHPDVPGRPHAGRTHDPMNSQTYHVGLAMRLETGLSQSLQDQSIFVGRHRCSRRVPIGSLNPLVEVDQQSRGSPQDHHCHAGTMLIRSRSVNSQRASTDAAVRHRQHATGSTASAAHHRLGKLAPGVRLSVVSDMA